MSKQVISTIIIATAGLFMLSSCDNTNSTVDSSVSSDSSADSANTSTNKALDWAAIATNETPIAPADFDYPFAIDSQNVKNYADYFKLNEATAQHNLTVSMASNEPLSKILDQLGTSYVSHELTDNQDMTLIIHTTPDIETGNYDYVFGEAFAKGLVLPIQIVPDGVKTEAVDPHRAM